MNGRACNRDFTVLPNNSKIIRVRADLHLTRFKYSPVFGPTIFANISQAPIL